MLIYAGSQPSTRRATRLFLTLGALRLRRIAPVVPNRTFLRRDDMIYANRKQVGFIIFGGGLDKRQWMTNAKSQGYAVLDCGEYAELYIRLDR